MAGSGLFGAVFARQAMESGKTCLVVEREPHVGGNARSEVREGIDVHVHGPHIFNTNSETVWEYACRFAKFNQYVHKVRASTQGKMYSMPINLDTLYQVYGCRTPTDARNKLEEVRVKIDDPQNAEEWCLATIGPDLYELFFRGYTKKQWRREPRELPAAIVRRLPVRLTYDDRWHQSKWCGIPDGGYTAWIAAILGETKVELGVDFRSLDWRRYADRLVYTGKIDELFDHCHGDLEYRTLRFEHEVHEGDYQGVAQVNYPGEEVAHTRITEHKHFNNKGQPRTVVTWEYPTEPSREQHPYYPIDNAENRETYQKYKRLADDLGDVVVGGRLGDYRYYDMDAVIASAISKSRRVLGQP